MSDDGQHSVHVDRRTFRSHAEEIAHVLAERCNCKPGWRHDPTCAFVTDDPDDEATLRRSYADVLAVPSTEKKT